MRKFGIDTAQVKPNSRIPGCITSVEVPAVKKALLGDNSPFFSILFLMVTPQQKVLVYIYLHIYFHGIRMSARLNVKGLHLVIQ